MLTLLISLLSFTQVVSAPAPAPVPEAASASVAQAPTATVRGLEAPIPSSDPRDHVRGPTLTGETKTVCRRELIMDSNIPRRICRVVPVNSSQRARANDNMIREWTRLPFTTN